VETIKRENMKLDCVHKKVYSPHGLTLTVYPPINISYWICELCGEEGEDRSQNMSVWDYDNIKSRFGKSQNITVSDTDITKGSNLTTNSVNAITFPNQLNER